MFKFYELILSWHDWGEPEPEDALNPFDWSGIYTAFWFIVIFCFIIYLLGESDKNKSNSNGFYIKKKNNEPFYESGPSSLHYTLKDDETVEINGFSFYQSIYPRHLIIPSFINSYPVTSIKSYAFWKKNLTELTLPNNITSIGHHAFYENDLARVTIPDSVTSMERNAFDWIETEFVLGENSHYKIENNLLMSRDGTRLFTSLKRKVSCIIPKGVIAIEDYAFEYCKLKSVTIPDTVTSIGNRSFEDNNLTSLILPEGLKSIGSLAFYKNNLTSVTIPDSVTNIGSASFDYEKTRVDTGKRSEFKINNALLLSKDGSHIFKALTSMTEVKIPNNVKSIGKEAFYQNRLKSVTIPNSVTKIGIRAFSENELESVVIGKNVYIIENEVFKKQTTRIKNVVIKGEKNRFNEKWTKIGFPKKLMPLEE